MVEAVIPVDLTNPGQVFACLGFMELCEALDLARVRGGFDWSDPAAIRFRISVAGETHPIETCLRFLARAEVRALIPAESEITLKSVDTEAAPAGVFPFSPPVSESTAPVILWSASGNRVTLNHWADTSGRDPFKTFAGQQIAADIFRKMLNTSFGKPTKATPSGKRLTQAFDMLFLDDPDGWISEPFAAVAALETSFGFDARGAWDALRLGSSADTQSLPSGICPVVELLSPIGLSHARPCSTSSYKLEYAAWGAMMPPMLARCCLGMSYAPDGTPLRRFTSHLGNDKYYKKFFFAMEITE